ncbi:MAG: hypothetical protein ACYCV7_08815, partial [Acidimicrobiales bacterium]
MAIMIFAVLFLLFSLWAYYYFTTSRATAIGLGTALSYFIAGGFTQAIGRRGLMYMRQGMFLLCLKVSALFVVAGAIMSLVVALFLELFLSLFPVVAASDHSILIVYYLDLSLLWLGLATLYMLQRELLFSVAIALGIAVVFLCYQVVGWNIIVSQQIGILSAAVFSLLASLFFLVIQHRRHRVPQVPLSTKLPRPSLLIASVAPYFLFGLLYFVLIFGDRIMAWTGRMAFRETFFWFRADYEVGSNWALLGLLPALGALEYAIYRFSGHIKARQVLHTLQDVGGFRAWFLRFYVRQLILFAVMGVVGGVIAYFGVRALLPEVPLIASLFSPISVFVFIFAIIGYLLSFLGLLNVSVFFWLSRPRLAILSVVPAVVVDLGVGFVLSRTIDFYWAVVGFTAGAAVFNVLSFILVLRVLSDLDYYYYSAI